MKELSFVSHLQNRFSKSQVVGFEIFAAFVGFLILTLLAQVSIVLPWTPVPITGQTFAVALISLLWGMKRAFSIVLVYLFLGMVGIPVFALAKAGASFGPTSGYLVGMLLASALIGSLSDRGWNQSFWKSYFAVVLGSVVTFSFGLLILSAFLPRETLLMAGLWPFLPGDFVKSVLAALISWRISKSQKLSIEEKI